ncbi:MAG: histidine kinase [Clostridiales bacterium]|nr:histidine kinase [Clostridiales bacterium]
MDLSIKNGDFETGGGGFPLLLDGVGELFQRAAVRLTVPLGAFVYNPRLGSRLKGMAPAAPNFEEDAFSAAQEALLPLEDVSVKSVRLVSEQPPVLGVTMECGGRQTEAEVTLS